MKSEIGNVLAQIRANRKLISTRQACIGFDGFIDSIIRVVKQKTPDQRVRYFDTIEEFGSFLISQSGQSCSVELKEHLCKMGGNMPIFSNALGSLGIPVTCIGALGYPQIHPLFEPMKKNHCTLYTVSDPGVTSALEFDDGKVMLIRIEALDNLTWEWIQNVVGLGQLVNFFTDCDLIGIVNWSEIEHTTAIWQGILDDVVPRLPSIQGKTVYFDLADCSKRSESDIREVIELLPSYAKNFRTVLGINENEARILFRVLMDEPNSAGCDIQTIGEQLYRRLGVEVLVIHPREGAWAWQNGNRYHVKTRLIQHPKISTGGGDNFNAGFSLAWLLGMDLESSLITANAVSGFYVQNGFSPSLDQLTAYLQEWQETEN